tara:strand:+ start:221 stop:472 length:252 start_codon:yes stop_codon:yes gene_type:complete
MGFSDFEKARNIVKNEYKNFLFLTKLVSKMGATIFIINQIICANLQINPEEIWGNTLSLSINKKSKGPKISWVRGTICLKPNR